MTSIQGSLAIVSLCSWHRFIKVFGPEGRSKQGFPIVLVESDALNTLFLLDIGKLTYH